MLTVKKANLPLELKQKPFPNTSGQVLILWHVFDLHSIITSVLFSIFRTKDSFFKFEWFEDGSVAIKGSDGKYLSNKQTGILYSHGDKLEDVNKFKVTIVNRPLLVLKSEFGFVGTKGNQYICNKSKYDVLKLQATSPGSGIYTVQGNRSLSSFFHWEKNQHCNFRFTDSKVKLGSPMNYQELLSTCRFYIVFQVPDIS